MAGDYSRFYPVRLSLDLKAGQYGLETFKGGFIQYLVTTRNSAVSSQSKSNSPRHSPAAYSFLSACALPSGDFVVFY
ncbi:MAG: hypothetical protein VB878_06065 [Pirellulaceae bacterium]